MKAAVIGFGKMGMLHAATLNALPEIDETIICETSPWVTAGIRRFNPALRVIRDYREILSDPSVSLAVITTPTHLHGPIFLDLIRAGKHVFVEKPFAVDYMQARECAEAHREHTGGRSRVIVGYCIRFMPTFELTKQYLDSGALGPIRSFEGLMRSPDVLTPSKNWRFKKAGAGGGVLSELGSHLIDMIRNFFGVPEKLKAETRKLVSEHVEDWARAELFYPDFSGTAEACWSSPEVRKSTIEITIKGGNGSLYVTDDEIRTDLRSPAAGLPAGAHHQYNTALERPAPYDIGGAFYTRQMLEWLSAIKTGAANRNGIAENLDNHLLMDLVRQSRGGLLEIPKSTVASHRNEPAANPAMNL